ncbi:hypothetical protein Tco_1497985, partial [Tanacetum coccineum]
ALLTTEAGCMTFIKAWKKEAIWLRGLLEELGVELNRVAVNCDNQGAIHLSRNHVFHERNKHINVRYHFIREVLEAKAVKVLKVGTEHNAADALTKVVPGHKLQHCLELLSVDTGSVHVLQGVEFEVEPQEDHTFEVEPHVNVDHVAGSHETQTQDLMDYHSARDREQHSSRELFGYREDSNEATFAVAAVEKIYAHESLTLRQN